MPDPRILSFVVIGIGLVLVVALQRQLREWPISMPMVYVLIGYVLFSLPLGFPALDPSYSDLAAKVTEYTTEFIVIISLLAAGIAIDRPLSWMRWRQVWPLVLVLMPLCIAAVAYLGWAFIGLAPASAVLLGGALAPTDPVLAKTVQVAPPGKSKRHDVRFNLTVEAGLNDGLAFPFTYLAIALTMAGGLGQTLGGWFLEDVLWRVPVGCLVGYGVGRAGAWFVFRGSNESDFEGEHQGVTSEGLVVFGTLLSAYGLAEIAQGYGFLAVFVGAVTARQVERQSHYHRLSHHFIDQVEEIVLVMMLFAFGGLLASGVLDALTWPAALTGLGLVLVIRPVIGALSQVGCTLPWPGRWAVAFLGIRGMGSLYYLAYGRNHADFADMDLLWSTVSFTILASIVVHGMSSGFIMRRVEEKKAHLLAGADEDLDREERRPERTPA